MSSNKDNCCDISVRNVMNKESYIILIDSVLNITNDVTKKVSNRHKFLNCTVPDNITNKDIVR